MARGRSPWVWGGAALLLGIPWPGIDLPILGVVPVLFLMFFVRPTTNQTEAERPACTRCASPHSPGQNFCTKCGWDLARQYTPENNDTVLASEMHQGPSSSTATVERPSEPSQAEDVTSHTNANERAVSSSSEYAPQPADAIDAVGADRAQADPERAEAVAAPEGPVEEHEPAGETAQRPWGIPVPGPAPTAAAMTAKGTELLSEGRLQEAIDQFTKAIALDSKHREAFERRAAAYSQQGREDRAQEDLQSLRALNNSI